MVKIVSKDDKERNVIMSFNDELREMVEYCNLPCSNCGCCNHQNLCDCFNELIDDLPFNYYVK